MQALAVLGLSFQDAASNFFGFRQAIALKQLHRTIELRRYISGVRLESFGGMFQLSRRGVAALKRSSDATPLLYTLTRTIAPLATF